MAHDSWESSRWKQNMQCTVVGHLAVAGGPIRTLGAQPSLDFDDWMSQNYCINTSQYQVKNCGKYECNLFIYNHF